MYQILDLHFLGNSHAISAFLLETTEGPVLIECGPYSTFPSLKAALAEHHRRPEEIRHVFLSHIHFDHAGAAWAFARHGATIHVHPKGASHLANPERLYNSARMIYGDQMDKLWGAMESIPEEQIRQPEHEEVIRFGGVEFQSLYTPGHAVHHIAWSVRKAGADRCTLFTGDIAGVKIDGGPVVPPCPPPDIHIEDWISSINILRKQPANALVLTHFGQITEIEQHLDDLEKTLFAWAEWIRPFFEKQTPQSEIVPLFEAYVETQLLGQGVSHIGLKRYAAANPAFMSVAGLMRYWSKRAS